MRLLPLAGTTLRVSRLGFGAGPVPGLLTSPDAAERQRETVRRALAAGVNWFDTAAGYGDGASERQLGEALRELGAAGRVHVATKVRLRAEDLSDVAGAVRRSLEGSLRRLGLDRVALLQLHNAITLEREALPTSLTPRDVLGPGGALEGFTAVREAGLAEHLGITGLGEAAALREVLASGGFQTAQVPHNLLTVLWPEPGQLTPAEYRAAGVAVIAIRVLAAGALAGRPPSEHTRSTRFFPLEVYERDRRRAATFAQRLPEGLPLSEAALRFALHDPEVNLCLVGFSDPEQVAAAAAAEAGGAAAKVATRSLALTGRSPNRPGSGACRPQRGVGRRPTTLPSAPPASCGARRVPGSSETGPEAPA